jgi:hypothetical protein
VVLVANLRCREEARVANDMTYRQLLHVCGVHLKDKFMLFEQVARAFTGDKFAGNGQSAGKRRKLPDWYKKTGRGRVKVVDVDGPMEELKPYLGKVGARKGKKRARRKR